MNQASQTHPLFQTMKTTFKLAIRAAGLTAVLLAAQAGEIGHFAPGVMSIRDFAMPEPGFYGVLYNYGYTTDRLNDSGGNKVNSVSINPGGGPGVTLGVNVDVDVYAVHAAHGDGALP